ncbi:MAG: glutamate 5-kinase [Planktomarina sp.]|nr:glutamate 5-kinase [Planktomarina sp.]
MATLAEAKRVVVKIGSALLVERSTGALRQNWLASLAEDIADFRARGVDVVIVSSGSIALGRSVLGLGMEELSLEQSQAAAAVGQIQLARAYEQHLAPHGVIAAQVLVTLEDSADRRRYLNSRATLAQLLRYGVVPIVNENDTVATDEIRYGDNDRLAAQIAVTVGADHLVLLSDVDGFYTANPNEDATARRFDTITEVTPEIERMAGDAGSGLSKGGMKTKLMAAKMAMGAGCAMAITLGSPFNPLIMLENDGNSTWFLPSVDLKTARKKWISSLKPQGAVKVDAGAFNALIAGKSLLPAGVTETSGDFARGELVRILAEDGRDLGCGLVGFDSAEAQKILGCRTAEIDEKLGYASRGAMIHRDDMVL